MGWRLIKQPNGLFARFTDVVDDFTHLNMSAEGAFEVCQEEYGLTPDQAQHKLLGAMEDWLPFSQTPGSGEDRWNAAIAAIKEMHGEDALQNTLKEVQQMMKAMMILK